MGPVETELALTRVEVSLAFSLALLVEGTLAYPVGRWIDRGHERIVMTSGSVLAGICLVGLANVQSLMGFYLAWAGLGAAMAAILYTPVFAVVTRRFPLDFRRAIITMTFLGGLASTVFIPLTAWLISGWGWRAAMLSLAAIHLLVCAPLHAMQLRHAPPAKVHTAQGRAKVAAGLASLMRSPAFLLVGSFLVLMTAVASALPAHMINLLREHGLSEAWVIAIPASIGAFQVLGRLLLYFFEHHFDLHLANRLIPALIPLGLLALLAAPWAGPAQTGVVVLFVVLFGMGNGMLTIVKGTAMAQYVSREHVATLNGALGVPVALARATAPLALGWMWSASAGYTPGLWAMLITTLVGVAALAWAQQHA
ncbi:MFS transporter [Rhodoferax sp. AJA081-3]|nr:MFS transporter [Rhodoferax sp. AJA081-3]